MECVAWEKCSGTPGLAVIAPMRRHDRRILRRQRSRRAPGIRKATGPGCFVSRVRAGRDLGSGDCLQGCARRACGGGNGARGAPVPQGRPARASHRVREVHERNRCIFPLPPKSKLSSHGPRSKPVEERTAVDTERVAGSRLHGRGRNAQAWSVHAREDRRPARDDIGEFDDGRDSNAVSGLTGDLRGEMILGPGS
jgi:hypothetical protein